MLMSCMWWWWWTSFIPERRRHPRHCTGGGCLLPVSIACGQELTLEMWLVPKE